MPPKTSTKLPTPAQFKRQFAAAVKRAKVARATEPRITTAYCEDREIWVGFSNGVQIRYQVAWFPDLARGTLAQQAALAIDSGGAGIHWDELDADYSAEELIRVASSMPRPVFRLPPQRRSPKNQWGKWDSRASASSDPVLAAQRESRAAAAAKPRGHTRTTAR